MRKLLPVLLLLACSAGVFPARAEGEAPLRLYALDASTFPSFSARLDAFDPSGAFITGLTPAQVTLLEDGLSITPKTVEEIQPGVQFAMALDAGAAFTFRGADAVSRLDKVNVILKAWAQAHDDSLGDSLSLVLNGASTASHLAETSAFLEALEGYKPDLQTLDSSLDTLSEALEVISASDRDSGMKRVVLYITSPPDLASVPALENLTRLAVSLEARVHVWIVTSTDFFGVSGATALKDLAILTGGTYALFSGVEPLPDPEVYLTPLRHAYHLTYASGIRTAGAHSLAVQVATEAGTITSEPISFDFDVEPPNPILVSPPTQIVRQAVEAGSTDFAAFLPDNLAMEVIIEFPDGIQRTLTRTALYVDGMLVDENTSPPFDRFTWDLSGYTRSGDHILQLQARDDLGLEKTSLGLTVTVTVIQPERGLLSFLARNNAWIVLGAVVVAGAALAVTLLVVGRTRSARRAVKRSKAVKHIDPLTAQVEPDPGETTSRPLKKRLSAAITQAEAWLQRLKDDGQPITAPPIPILGQEIIFGSDPLQATRLLDDPSVSPVHARLKVEQGDYIISDERSTSGTWVNYEMISAPYRLKHGDRLQIGRITYRFMLRNPPAVPVPRLITGKK